MFTVLPAYVVFFFACFVFRDLCRSECRQNYYLTPPLSIFSPSNSLGRDFMSEIGLVQAAMKVVDKIIKSNA